MNYTPRESRDDVMLSSDLLLISSKNKKKIDEKVQRSNSIQGHEDWFDWYYFSIGLLVII